MRSFSAGDGPSPGKWGEGAGPLYRESSRGRKAGLLGGLLHVRIDALGGLGARAAQRHDLRFFER